jgi:two-component system, sporulation sensor kinase E
MTESLFRRLLLRFALVPILSLCLFLAVLDYRLHLITVSRVQGSNATAMLLQSDLLLQSVTDQETGIRGYLIAKDPLFLEPYREAAARSSGELSDLSKLADGAPSLRGKIARIVASFHDVDTVNQALLQRELPHDALDALLKKQKQSTDGLRAEIGDLVSEERGYRDITRKQINTLFGSLPEVAVGGAALIGLLLVWHGIYLFSQITRAFRRQLNESETRRDSLHTTLESIGDAVMVCDRAGFITLLNPTAEELTGWTKEQAIGQHLDRVFHIVNEETRQPVESPAARVARLGVVVDLANHTVLIRKDGAEIPIDDSGAPIRDSDGTLVGAVLVFRSIAERRQAQNALRLSEERLRLALTAAEGVGIWDWDIPSDRVYTDERFAQFYGVDAERAKNGSTLAEFTRNIHPADREIVRNKIDAALVNGQEFSAEYRLIQTDNSVRWVSAVGRCSLGPDGRPVRFPGVGIDITARKQTEDALRESEARFKSIYAASLEYIGILNPGGKILDCNRASLAFADIRREDVIGMNFWDAPWFAYTRGAAELVRSAVAQVASGKVLRTELPLRRPSGEVITFDFSLAPVFGADGKVIFIVPEGRDIGDLKRVDEALRASEERLRMATETARLGTWELDLASGRMESSGICREHFGRSPNDPFSYRDLLDAIHPEDRLAREANVQKASEEGSVYRSECRIEWPDGTTHWLLMSGRTLRDEEGMAVRMIGVTFDLTDRRQAEAALLQSEKLAAVGRLAASIAHEINNPLEAVTNLLYLARKGRDLPAVYAHLDIAERELRRVSVITTQTLRFHKQLSNPRAVTGEELFESVISIYQGRLINSHVQLKKRERAERPVLCFDGEIRQVLNNLVGNAIDALQPLGGCVFLRSREGTEWRSGRKGLVLTVADTGSGINRLVLQKIFDPFYTTKGLSGTGLGLWVSKEIIDRHNGLLQVRSRQAPTNSGTVFTLFLPFESSAS